MSDIFKDAPENQRRRRQQLAGDKRNAKRDDCVGVAARFRLAHGYLSEFIVVELGKGTDAECLAHGLMANLSNLIANFAMNTTNPVMSGVSFIQDLANDLMPRLMLPPDHPENESITIINVDRTGRVSDYDFLDQLRP